MNRLQRQNHKAARKLELHISRRKAVPRDDEAAKFLDYEMAGSRVVPIIQQLPMRWLRAALIVAATNYFANKVYRKFLAYKKSIEEATEI